MVQRRLHTLLYYEVFIWVQRRLHTLLYYEVFIWVRVGCA